jgi:hypothetical protein
MAIKKSGCPLLIITYSPRLVALARLCTWFTFITRITWRPCVRVLFVGLVLLRHLGVFRSSRLPFLNSDIIIPHEKRFVNTFLKKFLAFYLPVFSLLYCYPYNLSSDAIKSLLGAFKCVLGLYYNNLYTATVK